MNTTCIPTAQQSQINFTSPKFCPPTALSPKIRVAVFGSFMGGYHVIKELLGPELRSSVTVVGVATDDPTQPFTHANVRLWRFPHTRDDELLVPRFAQAKGILVYTGRVKTDEFFRMFAEEWNPELCIMATFGQKIPQCIFKVPRLGFFNFHHSDDVWPSYPGPDPITQMIRDEKTHLVLTMHEVNEVIDGGRFVARSHRIPIPTNTDPIRMHRITWPQMGPFIRQQVLDLLYSASTRSKSVLPLAAAG